LANFSILVSQQAEAAATNPQAPIRRSVEAANGVMRNGQMLGFIHKRFSVKPHDNALCAHPDVAGRILRYGRDPWHLSWQVHVLHLPVTQALQTTANNPQVSR